MGRQRQFQPNKKLEKILISHYIHQFWPLSNGALPLGNNAEF